MVLNNDGTRGKLAWEGDNIKCDFDRSTIIGFDDWKLYSDNQSPQNILNLSSLLLLFYFMLLALNVQFHTINAVGIIPYDFLSFI